MNSNTFPIHCISGTILMLYMYLVMVRKSTCKILQHYMSVVRESVFEFDFWCQIFGQSG